MVKFIAVKSLYQYVIYFGEVETFSSHKLHLSEKVPGLALARHLFMLSPLSTSVAYLSFLIRFVFSFYRSSFTTSIITEHWTACRKLEIVEINEDVMKVLQEKCWKFSYVSGCLVLGLRVLLLIPLNFVWTCFEPEI